MRKILFLLTIILFLPSTLLAKDTLLCWNKNSEPVVKGYKIYVGSESRSYDNGTDVGDVDKVKITPLPAGTYYYAVTAYGTDIESDFSNEVVYVHIILTIPMNLRIIGG